MDDHDALWLALVMAAGQGHDTVLEPHRGWYRGGEDPAAQPARELLCVKVRANCMDAGHRADAGLRPAASAHDPGRVRGTLQQAAATSQPPAPAALARPPCRRTFQEADQSPPRPRQSHQRIRASRIEAKVRAAEFWNPSGSANLARTLASGGQVALSARSCSRLRRARPTCRYCWRAVRVQRRSGKPWPGRCSRSMIRQASNGPAVRSMRE